MKGYIYIITNLITQKQYIGQRMSTINTRYNHHIHEAKFFKDSMYIHEAMREYGFENFTIDELKCIEIEDSLGWQNDSYRAAFENVGYVILSGIFLLIIYNESIFLVYLHSL